MDENTRHIVALVTSERDREFFKRVHVPLSADVFAKTLQRMAPARRSQFELRIRRGYKAEVITCREEFVECLLTKIQTAGEAT